MRSFLKPLLLIPLLATLLGFASVHWEESGGAGLPFVRVIEVGAYEPWLTFSFEASHRSAGQGGASDPGAAGHYEEHSSRTFAPMTMSMLSGIAFALLCLVYHRLRPKPAA